MSDAVKATLETYFASLNSTSGRMMADINFVKEKFGDQWETLSCLEQSDSLWEALVKPEVADKYKLYPATHPDVEYFPILRITPGEKIVVDEDAAGTKNFGCSWRDEHSAPFHWETQSQLDLHLTSENIAPEVTMVPSSDNAEDKFAEDKFAEDKFAEDKVVEDKLVDVKKDEEVKRPVPLKRPEVPPPPVPPHAAPPPVPPHAEETPPVPPHAEKPDMPIYAKVVKRKSSAKTLVISDMKAHKKAVEEMKPAIPPRMSLELKGDIDHASYRTIPAHHLELIPKTGFDFLDNW